MLYINDLLHSINFSKGFSFADDTKLIGDIEREHSVKLLQDDLNTVIEWSQGNNMELHEKKFEVVSYSLNTSGTLRQLPFHPLTLEYCTPRGHTITPQSVVRDLGVYVSADRSWSPHIEKTGQGAFRDGSEMVMLTLYKCLVRSKLEYCCPVWNPSKIGDIRKLEDVQRSFTKKITGCKELTYHERLKKLQLLSLQRRRERYCMVHVWKIKNGLAPNDIEIQFADHVRLGVRASIPAINRNAQMSIRADYDRSFRGL